MSRLPKKSGCTKTRTLFKNKTLQASFQFIHLKGAFAGIFRVATLRWTSQCDAFVVSGIGEESREKA